MRPSALNEVYWSHSFNDLKVLTRLKAESEIVRANSVTESLQIIASKVFGGGDKTEDSEDIETVDQAVNAVNDMLRGLN